MTIWGVILNGENGISLRDRLRRETSAAHERVDALFGACDFATEQGYGAFLTAQAVAWETLRPLLDEGSIARADALRRDLDALGLAVPSPLSGVVPPQTMTVGHGYVLEGSRLGSAVLLRRLQARSPTLAERAGAYLLESGDTAGWKHLSTSLQNERDAHDKDGQIVEDALFVFDLFERSWHAVDMIPAKHKLRH